MSRTDFDPARWSVSGGDAGGGGGVRVPEGAGLTPALDPQGVAREREEIFPGRGGTVEEGPPSPG